jgi:arylsulfatase A-like enzyme
MRQGIGKMLPWDYTEIGGIPLGQPTVANWLQTAGYTTYAVGKWHCGYAMDELLPTSKGFDHFYGFYQGAIHYDTLQYIDIKFGDSDHPDFWEDAQPYSLQQAIEDHPEYNNGNVHSMRLYKDKIIE